MDDTKKIFQRETYWDTIKALLIFLVVLGHVIQFFLYMSHDSRDFWNDPIFKGIYIFHMPLFMLTGGFFAAKSIAKYGWGGVMRYLQRLVLPCVGMGLCYLAFCLLCGKSVSIGDIYGGCTLLWFLIVLFQCVVFYAMMQWKKSLWYRTAMFVLPVLLAIFCGSNLDLSIFFPHNNHFTYLWPFFIMGAIMSHLKFTPQHIDRKWIVFPIIYFVSFCLFLPHWYIYICPLEFNFTSLKINIFRTLAAIAGCGAMLFACKYLHVFIGKYTIIQKIGQATLAIYVLQTIFFSRYKLIVVCIPQSIGYVEALILSFIILSSSYLIYVITRKNPLIGALLYGEIKRK